MPSVGANARAGDNLVSGRRRGHIVRWTTARVCVESVCSCNLVAPFSACRMTIVRTFSDPTGDQLYGCGLVKRSPWDCNSPGM